MAVEELHDRTLDVIGFDALGVDDELEQRRAYEARDQLYEYDPSRYIEQCHDLHRLLLISVESLLVPVHV